MVVNILETEYLGREALIELSLSSALKDVVHIEIIQLFEQMPRPV